MMPDAVYVFGADGGFRVGRDSEYSEFPGPPDRRAISDWSTAQLAELTDGSIVVVDGQRLRWIFEPDLARWREPASDLAQREIRSMAASDDGELRHGHARRRRGDALRRCPRRHDDRARSARPAPRSSP